LFNKVARGVSNFAKSSAGRALGGVLKGIAKKALPMVGGALGSMVAPGIGTALGSKLGSMASGLFEFEFEALPAEQAEFEVARRYVRLASSAARQLATARPRAGVMPLRIARAAVARAARAEAPGLYRQLVRTLVTPGGIPARPGAPYAATAVGQRPLRGYHRHHRGSYPGYYPYSSTNGYVPDGGAAPTSAPAAMAPDYSAAPSTGVADGWPEPTASISGVSQSGRWVRRGRKIILIGV
jgi:hypothetical protein